MFKEVLEKLISKKHSIKSKKEDTSSIIESAVVETKQEQDKPYLTIRKITHNSVSVQAYGGNGTGDYLYSILEGTLSLVGIQFRESTEFYNLKPGTLYYFTAYKKGDNDYFHSKLADRIPVTTSKLSDFSTNSENEVSLILQPRSKIKVLQLTK